MKNKCLFFLDIYSLSLPEELLPDFSETLSKIMCLIKV